MKAVNVMNNFDVVTENAQTLAEHVSGIVDEDCSICPAVEFCAEFGLRKGECKENLESYYTDGEDL